MQVRALVKDGVVHNIVVSPGPGNPSVAADIGAVIELLTQLPDVPTLGVCLGHQALAAAHGGAVLHAPEPIHGRLSGIAHNGHPLFQQIPSGASAGFKVVRYHSLIVEEATLPDVLQAICWTDGADAALTLDSDAAVSATAVPTGSAGMHASAAPMQHSAGAPGGSATAGGRWQGDGMQFDGTLAAAAPGDGSRADKLVMGLAHRTRPHYGVQFHPESVATAHGAQLLTNFARLTCGHRRFAALPAVLPLPAALAASGERARAQQRSDGRATSSAAGELAVDFLRIDCKAAGRLPVGATIMDALGWAGGEDTFWLDSSEEQRGRFSFLGGPGGELWRRIEYHLAGHPSATAGSSQSGAAPQADRVSAGPERDGDAGAAAGVVSMTFADGRLMHEAGPLRRWVADFLAAHALPQAGPQAALPFDFVGGLVGYVGYELKAECGGARAHASRCTSACSFASAFEPVLKQDTHMFTDSEHKCLLTVRCLRPVRVESIHDMFTVGL